MDTKSRSKGLWCALGAVFTPFAIMSLYLLFSRWPQRKFTAASDGIAMGIGIMIGCASLACLPLRRWMRILAVILYLPLVAYALLIYSLYFVGVVFNDWL